MKDNSDNLVYNYLAENANTNPLYYNYVINYARKDYYVTSTLIDAFLQFKDPRVFTYAEPQWANNPNTYDPNDVRFNRKLFAGAPWGVDKSKNLGTYIDEEGNKKAFVPKSIPDIISPLAKNLWANGADFVVFSAAKVKLMEAEAALRGWISADAAALYEEGIRLSFEEKDVEGAIAPYETATYTYEVGEGTAKTPITKTQLEWIQEQNHLTLNADDYLAQPLVQFSGSFDEKLEKIAMQRWLNGFLQNGVEAWSDWRRLNVPKLKAGAFAEASGITHVPYRKTYHTSDYQDNKAAHDAIVAAQGPDTIDTRVWWDVADNN